MSLASIQYIYDIKPHPKADRLVCAKIKGWPVVVKKDEFVNNQLVVFITIDSIVPANNPYFAFLADRKYRVWNTKLRGQVSQGLVCPLSILPNGNYQLGDDVTAILGVTKYEKPEPKCADAIGGFPTHLIPMTDEINLLNVPEILQEFDGHDCYLTVKADGSSCTVINDHGELHVCSRRLEQKRGTGFWPVIESTQIPTIFAKSKDDYYQCIALQGEIVGPGINGNNMGLTEKQFLLFNARNLNTGDYADYFDLEAIANYLHIKMVPLFQMNGEGKYFYFNTKNITIDRLQEAANSVKYGNQPGEGLVLRPLYSKVSSILEGKPLSVKILNQNYE